MNDDAGGKSALSGLGGWVLTASMGLFATVRSTVAGV
jgi:hypothetical protein